MPMHLLTKNSKRPNQATEVIAFIIEYFERIVWSHDGSKIIVYSFYRGYLKDIFLDSFD
jgi:hypothetical protein